MPNEVDLVKLDAAAKRVLALDEKAAPAPWFSDEQDRSYVIGIYKDGTGVAFGDAYTADLVVTSRNCIANLARAYLAQRKEET